MKRALVVGVVTAWFVAVLVVFTRWGDPSRLILILPYGGIGGYLAIRRPANVIGWLLLLIGTGLGMGSTWVDLPADAPVPAPDVLASALIWSSACGWAVAFLGVLGLSLVFPEGRLPEGRGGRRRAQGLLAAMLVLDALILFNPLANVTPAEGPVSVDVPNPLAIAPDAAFWSLVPATTGLYVGVLVVVGVGILGLLARARRATGLARLQYRWLIAAILLVVGVTAVWALATFVLAIDPLGPAWILVFFAYPTVPLSIAVAVLRYRLYEIDRVISRTLSWAILSGALLGLFAFLVVGLQSALSGVTQGETLAVAASTLVAFALFQPARRSIQRVVDRRFNRAGYDAAAMADAFAGRLRGEVDLTAVTVDLRQVVSAAVEPTNTAVWIR